MRSYCALYIDAGYLLAAAATRVTGTSLRAGIEADHERLIDTLIGHATARSELPLLRVHWYDSARNGIPDPTQERIGLLPRVKLRLGRIGFDGEQKGVDLRIGLDLVAHARNASVDVIFLVSGDDDLTEAVEEAQAHGVQVTILAVPNTQGAPHGVSRHLQAAADGLDLLAADALDTTVAPRASTATNLGPAASPAPPPVPSPALFAHRAPAAPAAQLAASATTTSNGVAENTGVVYSSSTGADTTIAPEFRPADDLTETMDNVVNRVLQTWLDGRTAEQRTHLVASRPSIPREVDRALLLDLSDALGIYDLSDTIRYRLRARFWAHVNQTDHA